MLRRAVGLVFVVGVASCVPGPAWASPARGSGVQITFDGSGGSGCPTGSVTAVPPAPETPNSIRFLLNRFRVESPGSDAWARASCTLFLKFRNIDRKRLSVDKASFRVMYSLTPASGLEFYGDFLFAGKEEPLASVSWDLDATEKKLSGTKIVATPPTEHPWSECGETTVAEFGMRIGAKSRRPTDAYVEIPNGSYTVDLDLKSADC